jgi:hypothetical protein
VETRPAAGGGGNGKVNVMQRLFQRWISAYIIENISEPCATHARRLPGGHRCQRYADRENPWFSSRAAAPTFSALAGATNTIDKRIMALLFSYAAKMKHPHFTRRKFTNLQQKSLKLRLLPIKKPKLFPRTITEYVNRTHLSICLAMIFVEPR